MNGFKTGDSLHPGLPSVAGRQLFVLNNGPEHGSQL